MSKTCPKAFEVNSANEYWVKASSLLHTDTNGNDLPDPPNVRFYLLSGLQHATGNNSSRGICQQFTNGTNAEPVLRALLVALDDWVSKGIEPPQSAVPKKSDGTAVFAVPRPRAAGFQRARCHPRRRVRQSARSSGGGPTKAAGATRSLLCPTSARSPGSTAW